MDDFEKVEKLRERANVTYEEARDALKEANGDLLDAMVLLEKMGKTPSPAVSEYVTTYKEQKNYENVEEKVNPDREAAERFSHSLGRFVKVVWNKMRQNSFCASYKGREVLRIPVWLFVILLMISWGSIVPVLIILLFFDIKYSFTGKDRMDGANDIMSKASDVATNVREDVKKEFSNTKS